MTRFFVPLALQSASQGLTYPLVAVVASRGPGGPLNLAGLAQANTIMFMLGTLGFGLVTTGMVFVRSRESYRVFQAVVLQIAVFVAAVQTLLCLPFSAHLLFGKIIGLPTSIETPATLALMVSIPLQLLFFLRISYQVVMINSRATGRASLATLMRILLTALLAPVFCLAGWVGPIWAIACLTLPVALEVLVSRLLAAPFLKRLETGEAKTPGKLELFLFNLPLSFGGYLLSLAAIVLGAFIARAAAPERMLPAYYLALGLATPVAYGATRLQEVVLAFAPPRRADRRTLRFSLVAGAILGLLPLVVVLPGLAELYYVRLQNLAAEDLSLVRITAGALVFYPFCVAIRSQGEGLAALARRPLIVIAGQAGFMGVVVSAAAVCLSAGVPGNVIGAVGLCLGNLASTSTLRVLLHWNAGPEMPVPRTTISTGQVR
ncbi:MAG: hypothetical protein WAL90_05885 [Desulfobacterales bacterium]